MFDLSEVRDSSIGHVRKPTNEELFEMFGLWHDSETPTKLLIDITMDAFNELKKGQKNAKQMNADYLVQEMCYRFECLLREEYSIQYGDDPEAMEEENMDQCIADEISYCCWWTSYEACEHFHTLFAYLNISAYVDDNSDWLSWIGEDWSLINPAQQDFGLDIEYEDDYYV